MQVDANILVIGIVSHKTGAVLKNETIRRDQQRVTALQREFKSVFTMSDSCGDDINRDRVHHLNHKMNKRGAAALIKHLNEQNPTVKFDFICLEFVRMPGFYYIDFVSGKGNIPAGSPLLAFIRCLRKGDKLNPGCKLLLATVGHKKAGYSERWLPTKQLLETNFGKSREVEANANPYYKACVLVANRSETYNPVEQLKERNSNEKPFTEFTVLPDNALSSPFNFTDPLSEDHDEDSDADILLRNLINTYGHEEYSSFDVDAVHRDLLCNDGDEGSDFELEGSEDGDEESDCDSKTSTEDTLVGPSTENNRSDLQLLRKMVNAFGHEDSGFDVAAVNRDLCSEDGDEESDCDSKTSTEDTLVAP